MILIDNKNLKEVELDGKPVKEIYDNNTGELMWFYGEEPVPVEPEFFYIENRYSGQNRITISVASSGSPAEDTYAKSFEYSKDGETWDTMSIEWVMDYYITLEEGEKVYFRNDSQTWNTSGRVITIIGAQIHNIGGNIMSLLDYTDMENAYLNENCFKELFETDTTLVSAANLLLPSLRVPDGAYGYMFKGCTGMTDAPQLPATVVGSSSYRYMFYGCSSLVNPPTTLYATDLSGTTYAYSEMFRGCSSLTTAPTIMATKLGTSDFQRMFQGCTSLTTAPVLRTTELTMNCYAYMFNGCTRLNNVTSYADDISQSSGLSNWLNNVSATGTFHNLGSATYPSGASGIPSGWTVVTS